MAVNAIKYAGLNSLRGPSGAIWSKAPVAEIMESPEKGMYFFDDFLAAGNATMSSAYAGSLGQWSTYGYAGAQVNDAQLEGGVIKIGSDGDQEGLTLLSSAGAFRMVTTSTLALNRKLFFEARVARSTVATAKFDAFIGLMTPSLTSGLPVAAVPITTTDDTLSTTPSLFGFHLTSSTSTRGGPTEVGVAFNLASGTVNYPTNMTTLMASTGNTVLAADTYVKLGFIFDPDALPGAVTAATARQTAGNIRKKLIRIFVNGIELPAFLSTEDVQNATAAQAFPTGFLAPVISMMDTTGSSPGTFNIDWIRVAQLGNS